MSSESQSEVRRHFDLDRRAAIWLLLPALVAVLAVSVASAPVVMMSSSSGRAASSCTADAVVLAPAADPVVGAEVALAGSVGACASLEQLAALGAADRLGRWPAPVTWLVLSALATAVGLLLRLPGLVLAAGFVLLLARSRFQAALDVAAASGLSPLGEGSAVSAMSLALRVAVLSVLVCGAVTVLLFRERQAHLARQLSAAELREQRRKDAGGRTERAGARGRR